MRQKLCGVYTIRNTINGRVYVGSSKDCCLRWKQHQWMLRSGTHHARRLQVDWEAFPKSSFEFEVVVRVPKASQLAQAEQLWIDRFSSEMLYNNSLIARNGPLLQSDWPTMPRQNAPKLLGIAEVARRIGVDQKTLRRWADTDKVPHVRLPSGYRRWTEEQVQQILRDLGITTKTTVRTSRTVEG